MSTLWLPAWCIWEHLTEQGNVEAQMALGMLYAGSWKQEPDQAKAVLVGV